MKITVSKSELLGKLKLAGKIIQSHKEIYLYEYFLFEADALSDDSISVSGSDESGRITTTIACKIEAPSGTITRFAVEAKKLIAAISEIPEQPLILTLVEHPDKVDVMCKYATGQFELPGKRGDEYPDLAKMPDDALISYVDSFDMLSGLKNTHFCCANDELRPVMNGVFFDQTEKGITYVATSGHRLVMNEYFSPQSGNLSFILPSRIARVLTGIISNEVQRVKLSVSSSAVRMECSEFTLQYRLIDGRYPNYRSVIPQNNNKKAQVERSELIAAIKRVIVFSNAATALIRLKFAKDKVSVAAQDLDYNTSASEEWHAQYSGEAIEIGLNGNFLLETLQNIPSDEIVVYMSDPSRAMLVKGVTTTTKEHDLTALVMPLMINY